MIYCRPFHMVIEYFQDDGYETKYLCECHCKYIFIAVDKFGQM